MPSIVDQIIGLIVTQYRQWQEDYQKRKQRTQDRIGKLLLVLKKLGYNVIVGWLAFWTIYSLLAVIAGVGILLIQALPTGDPISVFPILMLFASAVGFISLTAVTYLRFLTWFRDFSKWIWKRFTAPFQQEPYYDTSIEPEEPLQEVRETAISQGIRALFISIFLLFITIIYDTNTTSGGDLLNKLLPLETIVSVLLVLFPPLAVTAAAVQNHLPESKGTIVFFALLFGLPAIPWAFPIRNAIYWAEHKVKRQIRKCEPILSFSWQELVFICWSLIVAIGAPLSLIYFLSESNL